MSEEKLACRKKAANLLLELLPYKAPCADDVRISILRGSSIDSFSIKSATFTPKFLLNLSITFWRASAIILSQS